MAKYQNRRGSTSVVYDRAVVTIEQMRRLALEIEVFEAPGSSRQQLFVEQHDQSRKSLEISRVLIDPHNPLELGD